MADACQIARYKLAKYVEQLADPKAVEKAGVAVKAGYIGGIVTPMKGLAGNLTWGGFRMLAGQPMEAGIDYIVSVGKAAKTGFKMRPEQFREVVNGTDRIGLTAFKYGFDKGVEDVTGGFKTGMSRARALPPGTPFGQRIAAFMDEVDARMMADREKTGVQTPMVRFDHPVSRGLIEGAFAAVEAVDRPFFEGAHNLSLYMQSKLYAVRQGLKGDAREAEIIRLMANPTDEMKVRALADAQYATFKDKNLLSQGAEAVRRLVQRAMESESPAKRASGRAGSLILDTQLPFTGVPSSVLAKSLDVSPVGLFINAPAKAVAGDRIGAGRSLANGLIGTGGIALGYQLYNMGLLTGPSSQKAGERADAEAAGIPPMSLKVGDHWVDLRTLGPVVSSVFVGAQLARKSETTDGEMSPGEVLATGAAAIGKNTVENSYLQNVKQVIDAVQDPERRVGTMLASAVPIPSVVGQASRVIDPTPREATTFTERVMSKTPLSRLLPEKMNSLGKSEDRTSTERAAAILSPLGIRKDRDTPELKELRRLGVVIGMPGRKTEIGKRSVPIPRDQWAKIVDGQGDGLLDLLRSRINTPQYQSAPDRVKRDMLNDIIGDKRAQARGPVRDSLVRLLATGDRQ